MGYQDHVTYNGTRYDFRDTGAREQIGDLKGAFDTYNVVSFPIVEEWTSKGITWKKEERKIHVSGTSTATSIFDFFNNATAMPEWAIVGKTYHWKLVGTASAVWVMAKVYTQSRGTVTILDSYAGEGEFTIPTDSVGFIIRLGLSSGKTVDEYIIFEVYNESTSEELTKRLVSDFTPWSLYEPTLNGMTQYYNEAKCLICNATVGDSVFDATKWGYGTNRVSIPFVLVHFNRDTIVESVDQNIVFKMHECASNGTMIREMGVWTRAFIARKDKYYVMTAKHNDGSEFTGHDEISKIISSEVKNDINSLKNVFQRVDTFYPFYANFVTGGVDNDPLDNTKFIINYNSTIRRSCFFNVATPVLLSMRNPDYVFRFYWYDANNQYHENAWATLWETPINVDVAMSIKRRDGASFAIDERPEAYIESWDLCSTPKEYYQAEIEDTISKVNKEFTEPGLCFLLSTDQHTRPSQNIGSVLKYDTISDMVTNMKAVANGIHVDGNIALGDLIDMKVGTASDFATYGVTDLSYSNLDALFYDWTIEAIDKLKSVHPVFLYTPGNHDDNRYINRDKVHASESAYDYTQGEMFAYYNAKGSHDVVYNMNNNGLDYYIDYDQFNSRMFFLDANYYNATAETSDYQYTKAWWYGFSDATVTWLQNQLNNLPSGRSVIICSHMSPIKEHNEDNVAYLNFANVKNIIQTFIDNGGDYIATIYGHTHGDWSATSPWLEIAFACQKCENYNVTIPNMPGVEWVTRTAGTYTEDSWNVLLILPQSRKIKVIRFGAGSDREFSY